MNEPQAFAKLCKSEGQFLLEVHEAMKKKSVAENSVAGQPNQKAPVGQVRQEVSMTRAVRGEGPVQVHPQLPVRIAPAVASRDSTGTSSTLPWVRLLDRPKDPPQRGLHPDRCKARVARDGGGVRRRGLWRVVGPAGFGLSAAWDEVGMHRYDFLGDRGGDRFDTSGRC